MTRRPSRYAERIRETVAALGALGTDPRHVEGWMRLEHGTLDQLAPARFRAEVETALACIRAASAADSESLAQSFGL